MSLDKIVVIIDDEPGVCETLQDVFEEHGYAVYVATDGEQALRVLAQLPVTPCIVILDLIMPIVDGVTVYRAMKSDPVLFGVPIVVTTSDPSRAPVGATTMKKPVNLAVLIDIVQSCCEAIQEQPRRRAVSERGW